MPPKRSVGQKPGESFSKPKTNQSTKDTKDTQQAAERAATPQKRTKSDQDDEPRKAARKSGRNKPTSQPSHPDLLKFMLSTEAQELCRPDDESEDIKSRGQIKTYSSGVLNPFEELLCAAILSRPISHRLGLRTIRTVLNEPYNFNSAKAVAEAGDEKRHQAVWDAKTQHKDKTAKEMGEIAETVLESFTADGDQDGEKLQKVLDDSEGDVDAALDTLKRGIKGIGPTGLDIFLRRVQWLWSSGYPFIDGKRTAKSLESLGLPSEAKELQSLVDRHWSTIAPKDIAGDDEAAKKRRAFVLILERAVGADLETKTNALLEAAGAAS